MVIYALQKRPIIANLLYILKKLISVTYASFIIVDVGDKTLKGFSQIQALSFYSISKKHKSEISAYFDFSKVIESCASC